MPRIQLLDKEISELIAAGEVVERPSSVIKELVENSIDSGASVITVEIRRGGISFMRVTDNGCGIGAEDVPTAFLRHATSKIVKKDDLDSIATLGFRGEALASIAAVSHVELLTRARGAEIGSHYVGGGAEGFHLEEAGCPEGTTIIVRDIFYNTPARMKFLKKDSTEGNSISGIVDKIALSHPEISFRFIRDGRELLHTPGDGKLSAAIYAVFGKEFSSSLIPVSYEMNHVKINGFISAPHSARPNRTMQNFFINGRYIRSRTAAAALEEAYKGSIMVGKFPACVLNLQLSFEAVDVNVHPAKMEVRFVNERPIFDVVYHGVKSALLSKDQTKVMELHSKVIPAFTPMEAASQVKFADSPKVPRSMQEPEPLVSHPVLPAVQQEFDEDRPRRSLQFSEPASGESQAVALASAGQFFNLILNAEPEPCASEPIESKAESAVVEPMVQEPLEEIIKPGKQRYSNIIGEAFGTYVIVEYDSDNLMLIDKHAAHERILYEQLRSEATEGVSQTLLEPLAITLDKNEYSAVLNHLEELATVGFEAEDFGVGTILLRTAPLLLDGEEASSAFLEIAGYIASFKTNLTTEHLDWVYHNVACRAAIKAGDTTSREELLSLAEKLEQNPDIRYCPHGRPVFILIPKREIEKQFGRI